MDIDLPLVRAGQKLIFTGKIIWFGNFSFTALELEVGLSSEMWTLFDLIFFTI